MKSSILVVLLIAALVAPAVLVLATPSQAQPFGIYRLPAKKTIKDSRNSSYQLGRLYCSDKDGFWCNSNCGSATPSYCCSLCYDPETKRSFCSGCGIWV